MLIHHGTKVFQEFYCRHCPADDPKSDDPAKQKTGGHFRVKFEVGYDATIKVKCPKCGNVHHRGVKNGVIVDGAGGSSYTDELTVGLSAWSRDPFTKVAAEVKAAGKIKHDIYCRPIRGGTVIKSDDDLTEEALKQRATLGGGKFLELYNPPEGEGE
jgi:hypothetical protein